MIVGSVLIDKKCAFRGRTRLGEKNPDHRATSFEAWIFSYEDQPISRGGSYFFSYSPPYSPQTPSRNTNCAYTMKRKAEVAAEGKKPTKKRSKNGTAAS